MEVIFKNKTKLTDKEYKIFLKSYQKEFAKMDFWYSMFYVVFFAICAVLLMINEDFLVGGGILLVIVIYIVYKYFRNKKIANNNNKKIKIQLINTYNFYKNFFDVKNQEGQARTWYVKMYKVIETDEYFYIYLSREYAYIISKSGFMKGEEKEFAKFIKRKALFKFRDRKIKK